MHNLTPPYNLGLIRSSASVVRHKTRKGPLQLDKIKKPHKSRIDVNHGRKPQNVLKSISEVSAIKSLQFTTLQFQSAKILSS